MESGMFVQFDYKGKKYKGMVESVRQMPQMIEVFGKGPNGTLQNRVLVTLLVVDHACENPRQGGFRSVYRDGITNLVEIAPF